MSNPQNDLEVFLSEIPVLQLLGKQVYICPSVEFHDGKVQLVCKYLKAYNENRINKLCRRGKCTYF